VIEEQTLDLAHDPSHELADAVVQRVFYTVNTGKFPSSPEFSARDQALAYALERSTAGEFGTIVPAPVEIEIRVEYLLASGRVTQGIAEAFTVTA
jgi:hypothetical protein